MLGFALHRVAYPFFLFLFFDGSLTQDLVSTGIITNTAIKMLLLLVPATIAILLSLSLNHHHYLFILGSERD